jgi:regulator of sigma E protease
VSRSSTLFFDVKFALLKKKIGDTEYGIGWLPLGGYVKIAGMVDESMDLEQMKQPPQPWEFRSKPAWQRLIIMLGGVTVNFLLGS